MALSYERRHLGLLGLHKRPSGGFSFMGLVRNIEVNTTVVNSVGVGPDVLHTFSLPANSLRNNGDYLSVWYGGNFAANARGKSVQAQFDGQDYEAAGVTDIQAALGWAMAVRIARLTATTVQISHFLLENALGINVAGVATSYATGGNVFTRSTGLTVANLNSNAITMRVRSVVAVGAAPGDVFQNLSIIELVQN
jgi:hypothetical protein